MATNLDIFTPVWQSASPSFQARIPEPTKSNFASIGLLISSDDYEPERNEIFDALINQIGKVKVWQRSIKNPWSFLKSGNMASGDTFQEIMSDVIAGQTFRIGSDDQFAKWANRVEAAYHKINREQFYPVTVEETKIIRAFRTEGGLQSLVNSLVNQMYSSNDLDEWVFCKKMIREYYLNTEIPIVPTQIIDIPDPRLNLMDSNAMKAFIMTVKGVVKQMSFPKTVYNPLGLTLQTPKSEYVMYLDSAITIADEVKNLAEIFRTAGNEIPIPIHDFDTLNDDGTDTGDMSDIIGVIADKQWLGILDTLRRLKMAENARNLYRDYYYHVHQLYYASPFVNCVFLRAKPPTP